MQGESNLNRTSTEQMSFEEKGSQNHRQNSRINEDRFYSKEEAVTKVREEPQGTQENTESTATDCALCGTLACLAIPLFFYTFRFRK
jgi:hypothetical protein